MCPTVRVVVLVAFAATGQRFLIEDGFEMAGLTFERRMCPVQYVIRVSVVVENEVCKTLRCVTGIATLSHVAVVIVVFAVAREAARIHLIVERVIAMAVAADEQGMLAGQFERGIACVIERGVLPLGRLVAVTALLAAAAIVGVVFGMARIAGARCVDKGMFGMATEAGGGFMATDQ